MAAWHITLIVVAYLAIGFALGIAREWAAASIANFGIRSVRDLAARFFFPISMLEQHGLWFLPPESNTKSDQPLLSGSGGGFQYWNVMAIIWPMSMLWSLFFGLCVLIIVICSLGWQMLGIPGRLCKSCETAIRRRCGITD